MPNIDELQSRLSAGHALVPQKQGLVNVLLNQIREAIGQLRTLGVLVDLVEVNQANVTVEWPKWLHHKDEASVLVHSSAEAEEWLDKGWQERPTKVTVVAEQLPSHAAPPPVFRPSPSLLEQSNLLL